MISKVVIGKTFYGACRYVCMDTKRALVLTSEGVRNYDYKLMAKDFERPHEMRSSLSKAVFHGIISFYPGEKIEDRMMAEIATEYLQEMKIINTQFVIVKHIDKSHQHLHIIANLINNNGEAIKDNWIGLKGKKIAQKLTIKYGLKEAISKNMKLINLEALNEKEAARYIIYQAILEKLPHCKSLDELKEKLFVQNIETLYKYKGQTSDLQGISFKIGDYKYKGSEIDRKFSVFNLEKTIRQQQLKSLPEISKSYSHSELFSQSRESENRNELNKEKSLLDELMKPEQREQSLAPDWKLQKKSKKKRGFHL